MIQRVLEYLLKGKPTSKSNLNRLFNNKVSLPPQLLEKLLLTYTVNSVVLVSSSDLRLTKGSKTNQPSLLTNQNINPFNMSSERTRTCIAAEFWIIPLSRTNSSTLMIKGLPIFIYLFILSTQVNNVD